MSARARLGCRAICRACLAVAGLLALAPAARAQAAATVSISVNATASGAPLERVWAFHGYDEVNYTTVPEGRALLGTLAALHAAPTYVRSHFLFNTGDGTPAQKWGSTNVYTEDAAGNPVYDFALTDEILDALTSAPAFPLVELGFMPEALSTHPTPYRNTAVRSLDGGCFYPPTDYTKWAGLVREWAGHAVARYPNVADRWLWELWNEPDFAYWQGTVDEFAKLYDYTEAALHEVIPSAVLGGPAVALADSPLFTQFLEHCASGTHAVTGATGTRLDLVSFHAKGGVGLTDGHVRLDLGHQLDLHRIGFEAVAAFPQFKRTPIYITEADPDGCAACLPSLFPEDAYRYSPAYGAYVVAMMKRSLELSGEMGVDLRGVLTWAFTFPDSAYFAGYRVLATNGIHLPVLGAFKLLGQLTGMRLPLSSSGSLPLSDILATGVRAEPDVDGMATLNGTAIQVLVWNYHDDLVPVPATPVHLTLTVPRSFGSSVKVSHLRVDESHGDAYTVWVSQGMPATPSAAEVLALQQAMEPSPLVADGTLAVVAGGSVDLSFELPRFGISLLTITPAVEVSDTGTGTEDAAGGCACRSGVRGDDEWSSASWLALIGAIFSVARRIRARRTAAPR
jgi:xylan 1,4-beta-xylosidase